MSPDAVAAIDLPRIPAGYREWNEILIREFFPPGRHGASVYLSVHDGLLDELGAKYRRGDRNQFLQDVLALGGTGQPFFAELDLLHDIWSASRQKSPPFVAGLAVAVLAAGDMETDENATRANYYVRLNAILGVPGRERPARFRRTVAMWRALRDWLREERRGELILHGLESERAAINAAKSQCLVRSCDVGELARAVRSFSGATVGLEPEDMVPALRRYITGAGSASRLAKLLGPSPTDSVLLEAAEALCSALEEWASPEPTPSAPPVNERPPSASLAIWPNRYPALTWKRAEWVLRVAAVDDADEQECLVMVGDDVRIARLDVRDPPAYDLKLTPSEASALLRRELRVTDENGHDISPRLPDPVWFQDGSERGRPGSWNVVERPAAGIPHTVATRSQDLLGRVQTAATRPGTLSGPGDTWPGPGLYAAHSVVVSPGASLPGSIAVADRIQRLRLVGGLPLRRNVYLRDALPVAVAPDGAHVQIASLNGGAPDTTVPAAELGITSLAEGPYRITHDTESVDIFVTDPHWKECHPTDDVKLDRTVEDSLAVARIRGSAVEVIAPRHATFIRPGMKYRLYADRMHKGETSVDQGIREVNTVAPRRDLVVINAVRPAPPLERADCFVADAVEGEAYKADTARLDRLLEFISAKSAGALKLLRQYSSELEPERPWHTALTTLEDLGHIDISWDVGRWYGAPAVAVPLSSDPATSFLAGARARDTIDRLRDLGLPVSVDERVADPSRAPMPCRLLAPTDALAAVSSGLQSLRVRVLTDSPAIAIAIHSKPITDPSWWIGPEFTPSQRVRRTLDRWDPPAMAWRKHPDERVIDGPALYRWREQGVRIHYVVTPSRRGLVRDFVAAKWSLAPRNRCYLVYEVSQQRLRIPAALGLPRVLRRACTLASGTTPRREGWTLAFDCVPLALAQAVAVRLDQVKAEGLW